MIDGKRPAFEALVLFMQRARSLTPNISGLFLQKRLMLAPDAPAVGDQGRSHGVDQRAQLREASLAGGTVDSGFAGTPVCWLTCATRCRCNHVATLVLPCHGAATGLDSMIAKTYYGGRVKALADRAAQQGLPRTHAVHECVQGLRMALEERQSVTIVTTRCALNGVERAASS